MFKSALVFTLIVVLNVLVRCDITKRDVHHRIIIQEKIPRNHKPIHHHHSHHNKNHHHYHDDKSSSEEYKNRSKYRQNLDNKDQSYEQLSDESTSYEQVRHRKPVKDKSHEHYHHRHKTTNKNKYEYKPKHRHHPTKFHSEETFPGSLELYKNTDSKVHSFEDNWTPLVTTANPFHFDNNNNNKRKNRNKQRKVKKEKKYKFPTIEFTTSYPQPIQYSLYPAENSFASFHTTLYPPIADNNNNNFVSKFTESNAVPFVDHNFPSFNNKQFEKKQNSNYEVNEPLLDNNDPQKGDITIQALMPFIGVSKPRQFAGVESKKVEVIQPANNQTTITNPTKRPYGKRVIRKPKGKFN